MNCIKTKKSEALLHWNISVLEKILDNSGNVDIIISMKYQKHFADKIVNEILSGEMTQRQASRVYNVPPATVSQWLNRLKRDGKFTTKCGAVPIYSEGEFAQIMQANKSLTCQEIAVKLDRRHSFVSGYLKRFGYKKINGEWTNGQR